MASDDEPKVLAWDLEVWEGEDDPVSGKVAKVEMLGAGARYALLGKVESFAYVHIAEDDETRQVTLIAVIDAELSSDTRARFPQAGMWLSMIDRGMPRVVGASRLLTRAELAAVLGGHAPPPSPTTIKSS